MIGCSRVATDARNTTERDFPLRGSCRTAALAKTIKRARELGLPVYLQVLRENRAADLYERVGFEEHDQTSTHRLLRLQHE